MPHSGAVRGMETTIIAWEELQEALRAPPAWQTYELRRIYGAGVGSAASSRAVSARTVGTCIVESYPRQSARTRRA